MQQYLDLLRKIRNEGTDKTDRTGVGTRSIFGHQLRFDLQEGFPIVTTKKLHLKSIIHELLWFLNGDTNVKYLNDNGVRIWNEWADANGDLGPVYGKQWRSWEGPRGETIDQISDVINTLKKAPDSRRLIVSAWNVADLTLMALSPCHCLFHFNTRPIPFDVRKAMLANIGLYYATYDEQQHEKVFQESGIPKFYLDCQLYQRSADVFLGIPFNIASYALLTMMVAQVCNMIPGEFIHTFGDVHIYNNHFEQVDLQLSRTPFELPTMKINPKVKDIFGFKYEDFELQNYQCHPAIKAQVAV